MEKNYVTKSDSGYQVAGSRVSLDSVVYDFLSGLSPESIADNYDTLTLEQVFGAITYCLAHQSEVEAHLQRNRAKFEALCREARAAHPLLYKKLEDVVEVLP